MGYVIVIAQVARALWLLVSKPRPRAMPSDLHYALGLMLFTAINPWHCAITNLEYCLVGEIPRPYKTVDQSLLKNSSDSSNITA